jgi:hypothetical protein
MFPFASVSAANPEFEELRFVKVVVPSLKLNEAGVKQSDRPMSQFRFGGRG